MAQLTATEIEKALNRKYLNKVIEIEMPGYRVCAKIQRISLEVITEPMVVFRTAYKQYRADLNYFIENTIIHGNTHGGTGGGPGLPKGD